jgi:hypothetical protein
VKGTELSFHFLFLFHFILSAPCLNDFRFAASRFTEARRAAIIPASIHFDYHNSCRYPVQTCHVGRSQGHAPSREVSGKFNNLKTVPSGATAYRRRKTWCLWHVRISCKLLQSDKQCLWVGSTKSRSHGFFFFWMFG